MSMKSTRELVDALYAAFLTGDAEGMLQLMAEDVEVRFLGQATLRGKQQTRRFMAFAGSLLSNVEFRVRKTIVDGNAAAVVWDETAETASGRPWVNHGVDVVHVDNGLITKLHENNDVRLVRLHFPSYTPDAEGGP